MLRLNELEAGYGATPVLRGINITLETGGRLAVLGRNGVGKTTLMRAIAGSIDCTSGTLFLDDIDLGPLKAFQRARVGISHVPQGRDIFPKLTVIENLLVGAAASGGPKASHVDEVLRDFPVLASKAKSRGGTLSGGQQQLLALGRALMTEPKVLLLDEPSEGIQPSILDEIIDVIEQINIDRGIAILIVEQNLDFAARIAQRALIMEKGELVEEVNTTELSQNRDLQRKYMAL